MRNKGKTTVTKLINTGTSHGNYNDPSPLFDWTVNFPNFPQDELAIDSPFLGNSNILSAKICCIVSCESGRMEHEDLYRASSHRESFTEVDIDDNEIMTFGRQLLSKTIFLTIFPLIVRCAWK